MKSAWELLITFVFFEIIGAQLENGGDNKRRMVLIKKVKRSPRDPTKTYFTMYEKIAILKEHNEMRRIPKAADMEMMFYNTVLEQVAQNWADKCQFKHNPIKLDEQDEFMTVGENVFVTTEGVTNDTHEFMNEFYKEIKDYHYDDLSCNEGKICGHYTQVVWHDSAFVGCGVRFCTSAYISTQNTHWDNAVVVVCDYGPGGNVRGYKPYKIGKPCSDCPAGKERCDDGLCRPVDCEGMKCKNGGKLIPEMCFCDCTNTPYIGDECEILHHARIEKKANQATSILGSLCLVVTSVVCVLIYF